jgi:hypothetical protein
MTIFRYLGDKQLLVKACKIRKVETFVIAKQIPKIFEISWKGALTVSIRLFVLLIWII